MSDDPWQGRTVLVTGASGFLGGHLCEKLRTLGANVHGISRTPQASGEITWHQLDLSDGEAVQVLLHDLCPSVIYHLASLVTGSRDSTLVVPMLEANVTSTVHLLEGARELGVERFILAGSQEEPEASEVPTSPYAASKAAATAYLRMYHALYQVPTVHMRTFMIYGPNQPDTKKLVPYVLLEALSGRSPQVGSGVRKLDWVYVDDVVDAYLAAGVAPMAAGCSFEVGSGELHSISDMVCALTAAAGTGVEPKFGAIVDRTQEIERAAQWQSAEATLSWRPVTSLDEGVAQTVAWYRDAIASGKVDPGT